MKVDTYILKYNSTTSFVNFYQIEKMYILLNLIIIKIY